MLSPAEIRARFDHVRRGRAGRDGRRGDEVRRRSPTWRVLAEAGIEVVGENRAQDLEAKHAEYGDAFRWHFIGRLQSNKVKVVNRICELVHSLDSHSAARRLEVPALVQVNLAGEASKGGVAPAEIADYLAVRRARPLDDAARRGDPGGSRPWFARLRELAAEHGLQRALDGHDAGLPRRRRGGRDARPRRIDPLSRITIPREWALAISGTGRSSTSASPRRTRTGTTTTATRPRRRSSRATASGRTSGG